MRIQLAKRLAALEGRLSTNDLAALSNEELENLLCAHFAEFVRDHGPDLLHEFLAPEPREARAFERWLLLQAGRLVHDDETLLPVTELDRQLH